jgi:acyl-CoA synthetase (AMP-forming)/AMP-acid ligase II
MLPDTEISTLIELLEYRARHTPHQTAFIFDQKRVTYQQLWGEINVSAGYLVKQGVEAHDRVVMVFPNGEEFFYTFYGVQRLRAIPVPIVPASGPERILSIVQLSHAKGVVVPSNTPDELFNNFKPQAEQSNIQLIRAASEGSPLERVEFEPVRPEDTAFIQFTSGSTGTPKGVQISHDNLITNVKQMIAGMEITQEDIFVSWLPVYHDMGLILMTMAPFYLGTHVVLLPTSLKDLLPWLKTIQEHQGTFTAAPDFAYRLLFRHIQHPGQFDLSSLRVALNAAEPVRSETIERFHQMFNLENVMVAGYGLAEATVGVSMWPPKTKNRIDSKGFVSVGPPFPKVEIKIVKEDHSLSSGEIGEIVIKSPANTQGYFNQPEATAKLHWRDGYIFSGDLGCLDEENNLYIVGRQKNIIKYFGRTLAPQEIEETVDGVEGVRFSAAVGIDRGRIEGEQVYVFAEVRDGESLPQSDLQEMIIEIVSSIHQRMGFRPARVYLLKPKSIPQTHNGKIQHLKLKVNYLDGSLSRGSRILYPQDY